MKFIKTEIEGIVIIEPEIFEDERGYFFEFYRQDRFLAEVSKTTFVQDNEAKSNYGVLRGLHFQKGAYAQAKFVRVIKGAVLDVAVDIRKESPTFGQHIAIELNEENKRQIFIPRGFAHGYVVIKDETIFQYKCDNYYAPLHEGGVVWNDHDLAINWILNHSNIIVSHKDSILPNLKNIVGTV